MGIALARQVAADDELLLGPDLELEPRPDPPAGLIARAALLGHDALELALFGGGQEGQPGALDVGREPDVRALAQDRAQDPLAFFQGDLEQGQAVEVEQVERLVDERGGRGLGQVRRGLRGRRPGHPSGPAAAAEPHAEALLEQAEVRPALRIEGDDLAIDHGFAGVEPVGRAEQAGKVGRAVLAVAGVQAGPLIADDGLDPVAVPLDLEQPVRIVEAAAGQGGHHRLDEAGKRRRPARRALPASAVPPAAAPRSGRPPRPPPPRSSGRSGPRPDDPRHPSRRRPRRPSCGSAATARRRDRTPARPGRLLRRPPCPPVPRVRTRVNRPRSFWPKIRNFSSPSAIDVSGSRVGASGS